MNKTNKICILYTETNGQHKSEDINKKNLYCFARLIALNYIICYRENNKTYIINNVRHIIYPHCFNIDQETTQKYNITMDIAKKEGVPIDTVLEQFLLDISDVSIIISHNSHFHIKTLISEYIRYNIYCNFTNYIIIDIIDFYNIIMSQNVNRIEQEINIIYLDLFKKSNTTNNNTNINKIKKIFFKLYKKYEHQIIK